jgi:excinuclease ABC subunit C
VEEACAFLRGEKPEILDQLAEAMEAEAKATNFEKAAALRDTLLQPAQGHPERAKGAKSLEIRDGGGPAGLAELQQGLGLAAPPHVIECFDISNISGTHAVASMVVAVDGVPTRQRYRHFRIKTVEGSRRSGHDGRGDPPPLRARAGGGWGAARPGAGGRRRDPAGRGARASWLRWGWPPSRRPGWPRSMRRSTADDAAGAEPLRLPRDSAALKMLQQLRDEAHRFALDYHRALRNRLMRDSLLDRVEGIGDKRKALLLKTFGSVRRYEPG